MFCVRVWRQCQTRKKGSEKRHLLNLLQNRRVLHHLVKGQREVRVEIHILALHLLPSCLQEFLELGLLLQQQQALALAVVRLCVLAVQGQLAQKVAFSVQVLDDGVSLESRAGEKCKADGGKKKGARCRTRCWVTR